MSTDLIESIGQKETRSISEAETENFGNFGERKR
jgi:hypothetical protein